MMDFITSEKVEPHAWVPLLCHMTMSIHRFRKDRGRHRSYPQKLACRGRDAHPPLTLAGFSDSRMRREIPLKAHTLLSCVLIERPTLST